MANRAYRNSLELEGEIYARALADLKTRYPRFQNEDISEDDRQALADTLEGLTDFGEAVDAVVAVIRHEEAWAEVNADEIRRLQDLKKRRLERAKANRDKLTKVLCDCVLSARDRSFRRPGYLLTVPNEKRHVVVVDIDALPPSLVIDDPPSLDLAAIQMDYEAGMLPERYIMSGPRRADIDAIAAAVDARQEVPGIAITYTQPSLQIR